MRDDSDLVVITKAKDLTTQIFKVLENSPKKFRHSLISKMKNTALEVLEILITANEILLGKSVNDDEVRYSLQRTAIAKLKVLDALSMIAREQQCILPRQYETVTRLISDCINLTGAWINSDKKRYKT